MTVERGAVDHGPFGKIAHREGLEALLANQRNQRFLQEVMGAPDVQVGLCFVRHLSLPVAYAAKDQY